MCQAAKNKFHSSICCGKYVHILPHIDFFANLVLSVKMETLETAIIADGLSLVL